MNNKKVELIKKELEFLFQTEANVIDFKDYDIGSLNGELINGELNLEDLSLNYSLYIDNDEVEIELLSIPFNLLEQDEKIISFINNQYKDIKVSYCDDYLHVELGRVPLNADSVVAVIADKIANALSIDILYNYLVIRSINKICPKCGGLLNFETTFRTEHSVYHCYDCDSDFEIEEIDNVEIDNKVIN